ncbi:MAG: peptidase [Nevskia sp.]|jgi:putative proteasome-type protease|nr:peptidase [Nevskia sp.]MCK9383264.1 peptidase [Nevskia sp.]
MTYCVAIKVNDGLVFAADTRTAAGVDDVRTYNKLHVLEVPGDRVFVILSAGNLATTQYVLAYARREMNDPNVAVSLRTVRHMFDAADYLGQLSVRAQRQALSDSHASSVNVETTLILGGQIKGEDPAIYLIYPLGNCIASSPEMPFLQIGEIKYGKPILDRFVRMPVKLEDAARCALVSLDSTMRSNISVGPPIDIAILPSDTLAISHSLRLDFDTPYYAQVRETWARQLENAVRALPKFDWEVQQSLNLQPNPNYAPMQQQSPMSGNSTQQQSAWNGNDQSDDNNPPYPR